MEIVEAHDKRYIPEVREIFIEYQEWVGSDLCFQNFEQELKDYREITSLPTVACTLPWPTAAWPVVSPFERSKESHAR